MGFWGRHKKVGIAYFLFLIIIYFSRIFIVANPELYFLAKPFLWINIPLAIIGSIIYTVWFIRQINIDKKLNVDPIHPPARLPSWKFVFLVVLTSIVLIIIWFFLFTEPEPSISDVPKINSSILVVPPESGLLHRDYSNLYISFKYPGDWYLIECKDDPGLQRIAFEKKYYKDINKFPCLPDDHVPLASLDVRKITPTAEYLEQHQRLINRISSEGTTEETTVNNAKAIRYSLFPQWQGADEPSKTGKVITYRSIDTENSKITFRFLFASDPVNAQDEAKFEEIIKSIEFKSL